LILFILIMSHVMPLQLSHDLLARDFLSNVFLRLERSVIIINR